MSLWYVLSTQTSRVGPYVKKFLRTSSEHLNLQLMDIQRVVQHCLSAPDPLSQAQLLSNSWPILVSLTESAATYVGSLRALLAQGIPNTSSLGPGFGSQDAQNTDHLPLEKMLTRAIIRPSSNEFEANMAINPPVKDILLDQAQLLQKYMDSDLLYPYMKKEKKKSSDKKQGKTSKDPNLGHFMGDEQEEEEDEDENEDENDEDEDEKLVSLDDRAKERLSDLENRLIDFNTICADYIRLSAESRDDEKDESDLDMKEKRFTPLSVMRTDDITSPDEDRYELRRMIEMVFTGQHM